MHRRIIAPKNRPLSQIKQLIKDGWMDEIKWDAHTKDD